MERNFRKLYDSLLESEELHSMFKGMRGVWEADEEKFIQTQLQMEETANELYIEIEDEQ